MAICFTMGLNAALTNQVRQYFTRFRTLPPMGIQVTSVADIAGVGSFEALASRIANTEDDEFVVVVHADPNGVAYWFRWSPTPEPIPPVQI